MALATELEKLLKISALAHAGTPLSEFFSSEEARLVMAAKTLQRAEEIGALCGNASDLDMTSSLLGITSRITRIRVITRLKTDRVIEKTVPAAKLFVPGSGPTNRQIIRAAAKRQGRSYEELVGDSRRSESVLARFEAGWVCVRVFNMPVSAISEILNRSHSAILSGINKVDLMIRRSPVRLDDLLEFAEEIDEEAVSRYADLFMKKGAEAPSSSSHVSDQ